MDALGNMLLCLDIKAHVAYVISTRRQRAISPRAWRVTLTVPHMGSLLIRAVPTLYVHLLLFNLGFTFVLATSYLGSYRAFGDDFCAALTGTAVARHLASQRKLRDWATTAIVHISERTALEVHR